MAVMNEAYITGVGAYLPGDPVSNEELAGRFGPETPRGAALRRRTLAANGIRTRHYAVDAKGMTLMLNEELAAQAVRCALADRGLPPAAVRMLATGTTQGDLLVPGFASMVHGRLGGGPMELLSAAGVCASGMAALRSAVSAVRLGEHPVAVAVGSELVSRSLAAGPADTLDTSFLRWTLSDGAGAVVVEPQPRPDGLSLRVDWMHLVSHAHRHPVCMSAGLGDDRAVRAGTTWLDRRDPADAGEATAPRLRQDMAALPALLGAGVAEFGALVRAGRIDVDTEHILCHYSAEHFRAKLMSRLRDAGYALDEQRWFTNLQTAGNTGAASIYVMLEAVRPRLQRGDRVLVIVPESGRFTLAFAQLTCVGPEGGPSQAELSASPLGQPQAGDSPAVARALHGLAEVWAEFERTLDRVPVVRRIQDGTVTPDDYRRLLLNLRQQVVDGGRWISLAAANFLGREVLAAERGDSARRRRAQGLPAARARLRGGWRRPAGDGHDASEHRLLRAVRLHIPAGGPARPGRPARRDVRDRGPGPAQGRGLGRPAGRGPGSGQ
jgi:3-oxoacyl-[acyl-carrier-protein] synthase III